MQMSYADAAAKPPSKEPPKEPEPARVSRKKIPKKIWVCFYTDANVDRRTLEFNCRLNPSPYVPVEYAEITDEFEKVEITNDSDVYNLKVFFKEASPKFLELAEIWKKKVGAYRDEPLIHTSFYDLFAWNCTVSK
jgi:hypothetical protein